MAIAVEVFDSRRNQLGEGPTATGEKNNHIQWCDIYGKAVRSRDLVTGKTDEYFADQHIGFQIPRSKGGDILGTADGPVLRDKDGVIHKLPTRADVDGDNLSGVIRWNDAKVCPDGNLFLGSMAYEDQSDQGAFYRLSKDGKKLENLFGSVGISNGMDWSVDLSRMFGKTGKQIDEIKLPAQKITSCVFAGEKLDKLIITSAVGNPGEQIDLDQYPESGFIFIASPGVVGKKTTLFGA